MSVAGNFMAKLRTVGIALMIAGLVGIALVFAANSVIFMECTLQSDGSTSCSTRDWVWGNEAWVNPLRLIISFGVYWGLGLLIGGLVLFSREEAPQVSA